MERKSHQRVRRHGAWRSARRPRRCTRPIRMNSIGVVTPKTCSAATTMRARHHEGGVEHIDAGDDAGALVGAGPGLHRRKRRHDVQAAGDRKPGEIDRHAQPEAGGKHLADAGFGASASGAPSVASRDRWQRSPSRTAPTSVGRMTMRPAASQRRKAPSRPRPRSRRPRGRRSRPPRCRRARSSPAAAAATAPPRRPARTSSSPARPTTAAGRTRR